MNSSRLGKPVRLSWTASNSSRSSAFLNIRHVGERADQAHDLAIGTDHRPRLEREPEIVAVGGSQPEILGKSAAPLLDHAIERRAETVAIKRVQHLEPRRRRSFQRAALEAKHVLGFRTGENLVGGDIPVPDQIAGAGKRERAALDVGNNAVRDPARERMLHDGEADQHHDQHKATEQRRTDDVIGDQASDGQAGCHRPHDQQQPCGNQQHRAVEAMRRQIDDEGKAEHGDAGKRHAGDAGGDGRIKHSNGNQRGECGKPGDGDVRIAHMPA